MADKEKLGLFAGETTPDPQIVWKFYDKGRDYNNSVNLDDSVRVNENFYIGKQWEGVNSNGLSTPVLNFLKRVVGFQVSTITSDNITVTASAQAAAADTTSFLEPVRIVNEEFARIMEQNRLSSLFRKFSRNAAVDGDGCIYSYWDDTAETGQRRKGAVRSEIIENTRVFFGDPNSSDVQAQPYIIISERQFVREVKLRARANGVKNISSIRADSEESEAVDAVKRVDDKCTVLLTLWRDDDSGEIWAYESTRDVEIKEACSLGIKLYPLVWLNWDYIQNSYHGQAMITGLIPNQILVNKLWAMSGTSLTRTAFPKIMYDKTRIAKWDNRPGGAVPVAGGDMNNVARIIDPAQISPQVSQLIQLLVEQTEQSMGATSVALGDTRPDNTSAIIALQRAASTPIELTKQNLYQCIEDLFRIYLEFMAEYYGERTVDMPTPPEARQAMEFTGATHIPDEIPVPFDFGELKLHPMTLKLDVGASSYYSEIASIQTLDNLLMQGKISTVQYLDRIPDGYIPNRRGLINEMKAQELEQQQMMMQQQAAAEAAPEGGSITDQGQAPEIPTGGGYNALARKVNSTGDIGGLI